MMRTKFSLYGFTAMPLEREEIQRIPVDMPNKPVLAELDRLEAKVHEHRVEETDRIRSSEKSGSAWNQLTSCSSWAA